MSIAINVKEVVPKEENLRHVQLVKAKVK